MLQRERSAPHLYKVGTLSAAGVPYSILVGSTCSCSKILNAVVSVFVASNASRHTLPYIASLMATIPGSVLFPSPFAQGNDKVVATRMLAVIAFFTNLFITVF